LAAQLGAKHLSTFPPSPPFCFLLPSFLPPSHHNTTTSTFQSNLNIVLHLLPFNNQAPATSSPCFILLVPSSFSSIPIAPLHSSSFGFCSGSCNHHSHTTTTHSTPSSSSGATFCCFLDINPSQLHHCKAQASASALAAATTLTHHNNPFNQSSSSGTTLCYFLDINSTKMEDVSMMDWQATPPAAEINAIYNPGKLTFLHLESEAAANG
jgi:hypothetical protein